MSKNNWDQPLILRTIPPWSRHKHRMYSVFRSIHLAIHLKKLEPLVGLPCSCSIPNFSHSPHFISIPCLCVHFPGETLSSRRAGNVPVLFPAIFPAPTQCLSHGKSLINIHWIDKWLNVKVISEANKQYLLSTPRGSAEPWVAMLIIRTLPLQTKHWLIWVKKKKRDAYFSDSLLFSSKVHVIFKKSEQNQTVVSVFGVVYKYTNTEGPQSQPC